MPSSFNASLSWSDAEARLDSNWQTEAVLTEGRVRNVALQEGMNFCWCLHCCVTALQGGLGMSVYSSCRIPGQNSWPRRRLSQLLLDFSLRFHRLSLNTSCWIIRAENDTASIKAEARGFILQHSRDSYGGVNEKGLRVQCAWNTHTCKSVNSWKASRSKRYREELPFQHPCNDFWIQLIAKHNSVLFTVWLKVQNHQWRMTLIKKPDANTSSAWHIFH